VWHDFVNGPDAEFIAAARTLFPAVLDALDAMTAERDALRKELETCIARDATAFAELLIRRAEVVAFQEEIATLCAEQDSIRAFAGRSLADMTAQRDHLQVVCDLLHSRPRSLYDHRRVGREVI